MAWGWSHSPEAYQNARSNLHLQEREWLEMVYSEWEASLGGDPDEHEPFDQEKYAEAQDRAQHIPSDILAEHIWEKMEEQALCTSGGWQAWACPYGCGPHLVSFDDEHALSEERRLAQERAEAEAEFLADTEDEELDRGPITP